MLKMLLFFDLIYFISRLSRK